MKKFWSALPISYKIFLIVLLFILIVQTITMAYLWKFESKILIKKEEQTLQKELQVESKKLTHHLTSLAKETRFLASLEVMDDLIGKDIDKRIATLLQRRADDLGEGIIIVAMTNNAFVASSKEGFIKQNAIQLNQKLSQEFLYFNAPVMSSFDKKKHLGMLVMMYPLKNLTHLYGHHPDKSLWLRAPKPLPLFQIQRPMDSIVTRQKLGGVLDGWTLHLAYSKQKALGTLQEIQNILFSTFLLSIFLLIGVIFFISRRLTRPINHLSSTFREIIETKDYSKQVLVRSSDEIGELSQSFNLLTSKTKALLEEISEQNRLHLGQLEAMISFFNVLIQTRTQEEAISVAKGHLKGLFGVDKVTFSQKKVTEDAMLIRTYDFQEKTSQNIGYFLFEGESEMLSQEHFYHSISKMIQQQLEHIQLQDATQKALEAKSTFLSVMSHDLRTPLGSILNLTQHMMLKPMMKEEELSMLGGIETSAEHLLSMINNILQLSKIESNSIMIDKKEVDLNVLLEEILDIVAPLIAAKGLALIHRPLKDRALCVSDAHIIKQIVINLLSNAIKFTHDGEIVVDLSGEGSAFVFSVKDSGIGIDKKKQDDLFQPFYQASKDAKAVKDSSGLGLALSQKMAHLIQGSIMIESEGIGMGTCASLEFKSF